MNRILLLTMIVGSVGLAACDASSVAVESRQELTVSEMMATTTTDPGPVMNEYFMPIDGSKDAQHVFSGKLSLANSLMRTEPTALEPSTIAGKQTQLFPALSVHFLSHGGFLMPVERDIQYSSEDESYWQIQVAPGRVWSEPGDGDLSRASFPFILTSTIENETYNGVAMFLYNDTHVSHLRYQVVQQLTPYFVQTWFVASGHVAANYSPAAIVDGETIKANFARELDARVPWAPWADLEATVGQEWLSTFDSSIETDKFIVSGLITSDDVYVQFTPTPYGPYPYPHEMRHGIWSVTKSAAGLLATLRIAQKYGDEIFDYLS